MPLPQSWVSQSEMERAGSPKNTSAPWVSSATMARMMAVMDAGLILPYSASNLTRFSLTKFSMAFRSLVSISNSWLSSAILYTIFKMALCRSFSSRIRAISSGPISETVVRRGMPFFPKISQIVTG